MPELPEVETVRRLIARSCAGRTITKARVLDEGILDGISSSALARATRGRTIKALDRHGKQLFLDLGDGLLTVHLGMTGDLVHLEKGQRPPSHARVALNLKDGTRLVYDDPRKFGAIGLAHSIQEFISQHRLGPDVLQASCGVFVERVRASRRQIKAVLLDQHAVAGIGNLYADEALYQAKVHPLVSANQLSEEDLEEVCVKVKQILRASIDVSTDFGLLPEDYLLRDRAAGAPCRKGHGPLESIRIGGRTTIYCPKCQKLR